MLKNYIGGEWIASSGTDSIDVINPATEEVIEKCPLGTAGDVDAAVFAAKNAFTSWRKTPVIDRIQPLFKLKMMMEDQAEEIAEIITKENGKTLAESRGSVRRAIQMVETATSMPSLIQGQCLEDIAPGIDSFAMRTPMGVFAGITPFNFPAMVSFWFWPFAVASGNTFVLKPSERVPLSQIKVFEMLSDIGLPPGVLNMVHGGKDAVNAILSHKDIKGVSFVGSTPIAKLVYEKSTAHGKRVQALGGAKNVMVVLPDAVMDKAVSTALESIIGCAGQRCLAGSVVLSVGDKTYDEVKDRITRQAREVVVGNGMDSKSQIGPVISKESKERILGLIQSAIDEGAELIEDGRTMDGTGYFLRPTVLGNVTPDMRVAKEEIFGPVVCLAKTESFDSAIEWVNNSPFGNTTTLFTSSGAAARKFSYEVDPAMIGINIGVPAPMSFFSFGGSKDSFFGDVKAHGKASVEFFTDSKVTISRWMSDSNIW